MIKWVVKHKSKVGIILALFVFFIIVVPLMLNKIYYSNSFCQFFEVGYSINDILSYYGAILTFIGTVTLGIITVYQNHVAQVKTDEVNKLTLELQKKSMVMAEQQYKMQEASQNVKSTPKFEVEISGCAGQYMNLRGAMKNVSDFIVSGIKSISFEVLDESNTILPIDASINIELASLASGVSTKIDFHNKPLPAKKKLMVIWKFQCEDAQYNVYYYKTSLNVEDSNTFIRRLWEIERIG